jgi:hypothetical protein
LGTPETANNDAATGLLTQIPYATKQGIILAEQGNLAGEQGILSAPNEIFGTTGLWIMSAVTPKADIDRQHRHVRFVPIADIHPRHC